MHSLQVIDYSSEKISLRQALRLTPFLEAASPQTTPDFRVRMNHLTRGQKYSNESTSRSCPGPCRIMAAGLRYSGHSHRGCPLRAEPQANPVRVLDQHV